MCAPPATMLLRRFCWLDYASRPCTSQAGRSTTADLRARSSQGWVCGLFCELLWVRICTATARVHERWALSDRSLSCGRTERMGRDTDEPVSSTIKAEADLCMQMAISPKPSIQRRSVIISLSQTCRSSKSFPSRRASAPISSMLPLVNFDVVTSTPMFA